MMPELRHDRGRIEPILPFVVLILVAGCFAVYSFVCPCERMPGAYLFGETISAVVEDWSFADEVPLCQVEVRGWLPHSVNVNCMSSEGKLFVSCSRCQGKRWSSLALAHPEGRIRLEGFVYPVTFTRLEEPKALDEAWRARARKIGAPEGSPRPDHWWSFQVESR